MTEIASPQNPRLKALRKLAGSRERSRSGRFLAEGEDLVEAAARGGFEAVEGFRLAGSGLGGERFHDVRAEALAAVSTLGSSSRVIGVYEQRWSAPAGPLCVYLHGVSDPGNVGTIMRSAEAFGASSVALGPGCADPYSPKSVRASMGAVFAVPLARVDAVAELPGERIALLADAGEVLVRGEEGRERPVSVLIGSEREGLPPEVVAACERSARIPIASESLNAAMAATVALYELTREPSRVTAS
ncbi:MAG TPA: RNA methyltransferase [Solirubrobacteraceae bacterium]|jgi:TrmH family RNA methyltransferase